LYRDLAKRPLVEILCRDLTKRFYRDLASRALIEILYRDLARRPLMGIQRPGEESRGLARRSCIDGLNRDLTLRSLTEIFCGDLLCRDLFKSLNKRPL